MQFNSIVLAKQVPDTRNVGKDAMKADGTVNRAALPAIFNPKDLINTKDGRIMQSVLGKATEMIYLKSENSEVKTNEIPFSTIDSDEKPY